GLSRATGDCIRVMDAMGKDVVVVETVGVGQDEIDIAQMAHTTLLVTVPGMGDDIQAIKAGILEVADVFIVNKADLDGADRTVRAGAPRAGRPRPPTPPPPRRWSTTSSTASAPHLRADARRAKRQLRPTSGNPRSSRSSPRATRGWTR